MWSYETIYIRKTYKIKKGAEVIPFSYHYRTKTHRHPKSWEIVNQYDDENIYAAEDWIFTHKDMLPDDDEIWCYVKLAIDTPLGNAFSVRWEDVEEHENL